jgi:hypothetical protein
VAPGDWLNLRCRRPEHGGIGLLVCLGCGGPGSEIPVAGVVGVGEVGDGGVVVGFVGGQRCPWGSLASASRIWPMSWRGPRGKRTARLALQALGEILRLLLSPIVDAVEQLNVDHR